MSLSDKINKSLSDKVETGWIFENDVKEAVKELKDFLDENFNEYYEKSRGINIKFMIDKIFGEKLCAN